MIVLIVVGLVILIGVAVGAYLILGQGGSSTDDNFLSGISGQDYSVGTDVGGNLERATNTNVFDKLNPFRENEV